jgi:hypothetical protein
MTGVVYAIHDLRVDRPIYVGQTRQSPAARWEQHRTRRTKVAEFIRAAGRENFRFDVLEEVDLADLDAREAHWIIVLGTVHPDGLNARKGGANGGFSPRAKAAVSLASRAHWADPAYRAKRAASMKARWQDPAYREKMSAARKAMWADADKRAEIVQKQRTVQQEGARRAAHAAKIRAKWADPEYKARVTARISEGRRASSNQV